MEKIEKAIELFNRFRSPEANAKLISKDDEYVEVKFYGHMCLTCGYYDYFEDFRYEALDLGVELVIDEVRDYGDHAIVRFRIVGKD